MFLLLLFISPVLLFLIHATLSRVLLICRLRIPSLMGLLFSIILGFSAVLITGWQIHLQHFSNRTEIFCGMLYIWIVYGCFSCAYFHLFMMGETARRLHILYELKILGTLARSDLAAAYGANAMLSVRLDRLVAARQLVLKGDRYVLQKYFLYSVSRALMIWGSIIGFRSDVLE